jgi:hypothetical protein
LLVLLDYTILGDILQSQKMAFFTYNLVKEVDRIGIAIDSARHGTSANGKEVEFEKVMERIVESN